MSGLDEGFEAPQRTSVAVAHKPERDAYPDVFVVCGEPEYRDEHRDVILNPKVIIEIPSPSTDSFDRGDKRERYQMWLPTLKEYVIVSQDEPCVERFTRRPSGEWPVKRFETLDAVVPLPSIRCELLLCTSCHFAATCLYKFSVMCACP